MKIQPKYYILLLLLLCVSFGSYSQKKNSVKIYFQGLNFISKEVATPNLGKNGFSDFQLNSIVGISYERSIKGKFGVGGQYAIWWGDRLK